MIPKVIHYCWFGNGKKPDLALKCINSWKRYCPDYEIIEWNESNIDFSAMPAYVKEAYKEKKWGFVPDYIRLWIIYNYGGIYFDTDVEVIKKIDKLTELSGFAGFELEDTIALGLGFGAEKGNPLIKALMESYSNLHFINEDGSLNTTPAPQINRTIFLNAGFVGNGQMQTHSGITVFPKEFFCPISFETGEKKITQNTYSIHHYMASWLTDSEKKAHKKEILQKKYWWVDKVIHAPNIIMRNVLGDELYEKVKGTIKKS